MGSRVKDIASRCVTGLHMSVFSVTNGRLLGRMAGMPVVMLTTTGRKSGRPRATMLTSPLQLGESVVLVASNGGDHRHPRWFLNLRENPDVEIVMEGRHRRMHARVAAPGEMHELWPKVTQVYPRYAEYQKKTTRDIPFVILDPAGK